MNSENSASQKLTRKYMETVIFIGAVLVCYAFWNFPASSLSFNFLILSVLTVALGSQITVQIPHFKSHIAVSDTFIFLALFLFGGEAAVVLAAVEAFFSSWRFCKKKISVFFNTSAMAISTGVVVLTLKFFEVNPASVLLENDYSKLAVSLSVMACVQFAVNSVLASVYGALKSETDWREIWKKHYIWTSLTYFVGAIAAGILAKLNQAIGFGVIIATVPVIIFVYLTYRMYLKNVEMSLAQALQAENHAKLLEEKSVALSASEERFRSAFNYAPIGIAIVSPDGKWLKVNKALSKILGYTEEEFLATDYLSMLCKDDLGNTLIQIHELSSGKTPTCKLEQRYLNKRGEMVWVSWSVSAVSEHTAERQNLIFQIQDITDKKLAEEQLQYKATHDALTGLPNRAYFLARLEQALENVADNLSDKVSVLFIDIDRFKIVNDSLGHQIGDKLLIEISHRLRECLRPRDVVARLGGDEFTILIEGGFDQKEVINIAERIREKFLHPFDLNGNEVFSSASIGILNASEKHLTAEEIMRDADIAMYQAKRAGKARHEIFDQNMHEEVKKTLQIETDLRRAIENKEITVCFQPIYSLQNEYIEGFEALARWEHTENGTIPPTKFIPLAEEIGLIDKLGEHILRTACVQGCELQNIFTGENPLKISVNFSCRQFSKPDVVNSVKKILAETGFAPQNLRLEITESVFMKDAERAIQMMNEFREIGIEINIDDFGTGYSNLQYLTKLPASVLKIDRSFISPLDETGQNTELVQTILTLAKSLGMRVIAEGVENEIQLEKLKSLNCESAQGYYFSKPLNFADTQEFLKKNQACFAPIANIDNFSVVSVVQ